MSSIRFRTLMPLIAVLVLWVTAPAHADNVVPDDEIVQGSLCAGPDCVDNESFGFDTIRLKGPVLRLGFLDTSTSTGFPTNDWELTANDADGSGTQSFFGFTDVSGGGATPLRVLAGAPTDTARLEPDGSVSLTQGPLLQQVDGTSTENAAAVDGAALRTALDTLPISRFEFTADPANTLHLGPTAADFNTAFGVGSGATFVSPSDMAGVALAVGKELSARTADLTGPAGPRGGTGPQGATGPKGDVGPAGPGAPSPAGLATALERLHQLEYSQDVLRRRNEVLTGKVSVLQRRLRALRRRIGG